MEQTGPESHATPPPGPARPRLWILVPCGLALIALFAALSELSARFVLGEGHELRPIESFLGLFFAAFVVYLGALGVVLQAEAPGPASGASHPSRKPWRALVWLVAVAVIARGVLLPSRPIQEIDYARYLWDGAVLAHGHNPYRFAPKEVFPGPARGEGNNEAPPLTDAERAALLELRTLRSESAGGEEHHRWINYPHVRTIYPPLAQAVFAAGHLLAPWRLAALRVIFTLLELGAMLLLIDALRRLNLSPLRVAVYAWSPLAIKELANSTHLDAIVIFCLAWAIWAWAADRPRWMGVALGLGILAKTFPLVLLPVAAGAVARARGARAAVEVVALALGLAAAGYAPFVWDAGLTVFEGHARFASDWEMNAGLYVLLHHAAQGAVGLFGEADAAWTLLGKTKPAATWLARGMAAGTVLAVVAAATVRREGNGGRRTLIARWLAVLATLLLCAPTGNPWYATWLLPFLCFVPVRGLILLTGLIALYYVKFITEYRDAELRGLGMDPRTVFNEMRWAQYLPVYAVLLSEGTIAWFRRRKETTRPRSEQPPPPGSP